MATHSRYPTPAQLTAEALTDTRVKTRVRILERWRQHRAERERRVIVQWLRRTADRAHDTDPIRRRREALLHYRAAAVRSDLQRSECLFRGETITGLFRVLSVWARHDGDWRLTAIQYTRQTEYPAFRKAYQKFRTPGRSYEFLAFNLRDPRFADHRVRQAFAHAINKKEIIEGVVLGMAGFAISMFTYDAFAFIQVTFLLFILLGLACSLLSVQARHGPPQERS